MKQKKEKIMLMLSFVVVFSFGLSTLFSIYSLNELISENSREKSIVYANEITSTVNSIFSEPRAVAMGINNTLLHNYVKKIDEYSPNEISEIFKEYLLDTVQYFNYDTAFIAPVSNLHYYTEHGDSKVINYDNNDDDWYEAFLNSGEKYELNVDNDQANDNRTTIYINVRMEDKDQLLGACGVGLTMDEISNMIKRFELIQGYDIKLISKNGKIQVSNSTNYKADVLSKNTKNVYSHANEEIQGYIDNYDNSKSYNYIQRDKNSFSIVKYIEQCQWYLVIDYKGKTLPDAYTLLLKNVIACIAVLLLLIILTNIITRRIQHKMNEFRKKSEVDKLTGIFNRHAFEEKKYSFEGKSVSDITVAVLDINSLKKVNDTIGHNAGDELIIGAAKIIEKFFENYGTTYRIGGDEFVVIIDKAFKNIPEQIKKFKNEVKQWKGKLVESMNISVGIISGNMYEYMRIEELIELADKEMYEDKRIFYEENQIDRRRH